ncbi:hypothetical protein [Empedobacter sp. GD03797]|uniref:hypothetical protein n=1 Tax=Empedobacter sp. GD03797 TaxID=2975382 RepID=UPI00244A84D8|nr:hypothetical protein [Empedobacter sp. GD03797]MDH1882894.1 hypothetical protein [Empedobacter sp. GD03797]
MKNKEILYSATAIVIALIFCITYYFVKSDISKNNRYQFSSTGHLVLDKKTGDVFTFRNEKKVKMQEGESY